MAIKQPTIGQIISGGWISPDGITYIFPSNIQHGEWILQYYQWLVSKGYDLHLTQEMVNGMFAEDIRNMLIEKFDWIRVRTLGKFTVCTCKSLDSDIKRIKQAVKDGKIKYDDDGSIIVEDLNSNSWESTIKRLFKKASDKKDKLSCLTISLPDNLQEKIKSWTQKHIKKENLINKGYEKHPHVTILEELYTNDKSKVKDFLKDQEAIDVEFGRISKFRNDDKSDVIKIEVYGPDIQKIHKKVSKYFDHPKSKTGKYLAHITLAYVKKDSCENLVNNKEFDGEKYKLNKFVFLDYDSEPHSIYVKGSKIDYPQPDLPESMWDKVDNQYILKPNIEKMIKGFSEKILEKNFINYKTFYVTCLLGSSVTTQFWNEDSDIDIKIVFDKQKFLKQNPKYARMDVKKIIESLAEIFDLDKYKFKFENHPVEFYPEFEESLTDPDFLKRFDSLYDVEKRIWIKPVKLVNIDNYDRDAVVDEGEKQALEWATRWDLQLGNIKRKASEFELVKNYVKTLDKDRKLRFKSKMDKLLQELKHDIEKIHEEKTLVKEEYHGAYDRYDENLERYYGSVNAMPEVIRIKMLNLWGYISILKALNEIVEDQPTLDKNDVKEIKHVLKGSIKLSKREVRFLSIREASVNKKFWISPDGKYMSWPAHDVYESEFHHEDKICEFSGGKYASTWTAVDGGWVRGGNINNELYISAYNLERVVEALKQIPKEDRMCDTLTVNLFDGGKVPDLKTYGQDPILALQRWIRDQKLQLVEAQGEFHMLKLSFRDVEADFNKVAYIVNENGKYCVKSHKGKNLGCYDSKSGAEERLRQVEYFKSKG